MKFERTKPCSECPFVGHTPGWTGAHKSAREFVEIARSEELFPCHATIDYTDPEWREQLDEAQHCVGIAAFRRKLCKIPRDHAVAAHQARIHEAVTVVWPPDRLVDLHDNVIPRLRQMEALHRDRGDDPTVDVQEIEQLCKVGGLYFVTSAAHSRRRTYRVYHGTQHTRNGWRVSIALNPNAPYRHEVPIDVQFTKMRLITPRAWLTWFRCAKFEAQIPS